MKYRIHTDQQTEYNHCLTMFIQFPSDRYWLVFILVIPSSMLRKCCFTLVTFIYIYNLYVQRINWNDADESKLSNNNFQINVSCAKQQSKWFHLQPNITSVLGNKLTMISGETKFINKNIGDVASLMVNAKHSENDDTTSFYSFAMFSCCQNVFFACNELIDTPLLFK